MSGPIRWGRPLTPEEIAQDKRRQENDRKYGPGNWVDFTSPHELYGDSQARAIEARRALAADIAAAIVQAQCKNDEPAQAAQAGPAAPTPYPVRTRRDCLRDAMESAFDVLEDELGRPPNDSEMWGYLTKRDKSGYITDSSDNLICWRDWAGGKKTASKRNISDRLNNILKSRNG